MFNVLKKTVSFGLVTLFMVMASLVFMAPAAVAHDLWVNAHKYKDGLFRAEIGYSHEFPGAEPIAPDRVHIFKPLRLVTPDGMLNLDQSGENYAYQKKVKLQKGSYLVLGSYRPTYWADGPGGWTQQDRVQRPDATYVEEAVMYAKTIVNLQGSTKDALITAPVGDRLEVVPKMNPARVRHTDKLLVQVLFDGNPIEAVDVDATLIQLSGKKSEPFHGKTDKNGLVAISPMKKGYWMVKTHHKCVHPNQDRADKIGLVATLTYRMED